MVLPASGWMRFCLRKDWEMGVGGSDKTKYERDFSFVLFFFHCRCPDGMGVTAIVRREIAIFAPETAAELGCGSRWRIQRLWGGMWQSGKHGVAIKKKGRAAVSLAGALKHMTYRDDDDFSYPRSDCCTRLFFFMYTFSGKCLSLWFLAQYWFFF